MSTPGDLVVGRYRLVRQLGDGGLGDVWEALDELLEQTVAVRELQSQRSLNPTEGELAVREARMTARLEHPWAVSVLDAVDHQGQIWLIMQFVPSQPLSTLLRGLAVLSPEETARIGFQVASALAAAHELGIVHGDVRPGNVLIADDGTALISGFGSSRALRYDADVHGLGATLYAAAEGAPPFGRHVGTPTPTVGLTPLLLRMLADNPSGRPWPRSPSTWASSVTTTRRRSRAPLPPACRRPEHLPSRLGVGDAVPGGPSRRQGC